MFTIFFAYDSRARGATMMQILCVDGVVGFFYFILLGLWVMVTMTRSNRVLVVGSYGHAGTCFFPFFSRERYGYGYSIFTFMFTFNLMDGDRESGRRYVVCAVSG